MNLYTIGHSKHPMEKFIGLLKLHGIDIVVDVRSHPMSRFNPQFNRKKLEAELLEHQVKYVYMGSGLGGRPDGEQFYDEKGFILYHRMAQSTAFKTELSALVELCKTARVSVMCSEEDPDNCHRKLLIGKALLKSGSELEELTIMHIRSTGAIETDAGQLDLAFDENWKSPKPLSKNT